MLKKKHCVLRLEASVALVQLALIIWLQCMSSSYSERPSQRPSANPPYDPDGLCETVKDRVVSKHLELRAGMDHRTDGGIGDMIKGFASQNECRETLEDLKCSSA